MDDSSNNGNILSLESSALLSGCVLERARVGVKKFFDELRELVVDVDVDVAASLRGDYNVKHGQNS